LYIHSSNLFFKGSTDCNGGTWTDYFSSDSPNNVGDFETLSKVRLIDPTVCENPISADARRKNDTLHWSLLNRGKLSSTGFVCRNYLPYANTDLEYWPCDDYEIRFCCPDYGKFDLMHVVNGTLNTKM